MDTKTLEALGITKEELVNRAVDQIVNNMTRAYGIDDEGETHYTGKSSFMAELDKYIKAKLDAKLAASFDALVAPKVIEKFDNFVLQETNSWGEKKKPPQTLTEYMIQRADAYLLEKVDDRGGKSDYSTRGEQTRIAYLVNEHLKLTIKDMVSSALGGVNAAVATGIQEVVRSKLNEVATHFTVETEVKTRR